MSVELGKAIDGIHYTHALSTKMANLFHNAQHLDHQVSFIFSKDNFLSFSHPEAEQWYTDTALTSLTTNIVPSKSNSNMCKNALVLRTLMIPLIRFKLNKVLKTKGKLLIKKYSNSSNYMLL